MRDMNKHFDRIIVSAEDRFLDFWPTVSTAWQLHFGIKPTLALVTHSELSDEVVQKLTQFGDVMLFKAVPFVPIQNQAKLVRFIAASYFPDEVCTIEDIDTIPLQSQFVNDRLSQRKKGKILAVGKEVYDNSEHQGKFPISQLTSEGRNFGRLFNPKGLDYEQFIRSLVGLRIFDQKENVANAPEEFSDESLIRALIQINEMQVDVQHVERNVDAKRQWIDRTWWGIDKSKLRRGEYVICNFFRPFRENFHFFEDVLEYTYKRKVSLEEACILREVPELNNFGGSGVEKVVIDHIKSLVDQGSNVVELGAGLVSTRELSKHYNLFSIEQDSNYCGLYKDVNYIYAPISGNWYDSEIVKSGLPNNISCVLVDGPLGKGLRKGILENLHLFQVSKNGIWVFHDTWRPEEKQLAEDVARALNCKIKHFENEDYYSILYR